MSIARKILMGAAGAGGDSTYVDDVFSTYLYKGSKPVAKSVNNGIKLSNANAGTSVQFVASSSQYLKVPQHSSLELGTGDYCIECWVRPTRSGSPNEGIWTYGSYDGNGGMLAWIHGNTLKIFCARTNADICNVNNWRQQNVWTHLAVTRYSGTTKTFSNGVEIATSTEQNNDNVGEAANNMNQFFLGCERNNTNNIGGFFEGNISNMRIVKGSAVYTSNFTPPTKALTSTTTTVVLFCQSSISATAATKTPIAITSSGDPTTNSFGPFTADDGEGGLVWIKSRTNAYFHVLQDTERGTTKVLKSNSNEVEMNTSQYMGSFDNNGFSFKYDADNDVNNPNQDFSSWTFRKAPGFFDIVTYTGTGSVINLPHSLGCVPGCVMIKKRSGTDNWSVYHRGLDANVPEQYWIALNATYARMGTSGTTWNDTKPTSTHVTIGAGDQNVNTNGATYVAYIFAGGESTADAARSVDFDGSDVCWSDSSDNTLGTSDFTLEYWFKPDSNPSSGNYSNLVDYSDNDWSTRIQPDGTHQYLSGASVRLTSTTSLGEGQWHHIAIVRSSGTSRMYVNGVQEGGTYSDSTNYSFTLFYMGRRENGTNPYDGKISNLRLVVGTAVYTSSFRPPTEPLTNITNTKLLALNNSSVTGTTVGTITVSGNSGLLPTASTDSPFDDPEGFKFGEGGDQNIIKCGSYKTDSNEDAIIDLGWEPQWVLAKRKDSSTGGDWMIYDSLRGLSNRSDVLRENGVSSALLVPNITNAETNARRIGVYQTGFVQDAYGANREYIYIAIRRPDSFVGKPAEVGTDVFAMDAGAGSNSLPEFISNFPIDFVLRKNIIHAGNPWRAAARMMQGEFLEPNNTSSTSNSASLAAFDSNVGFCEDGADSNYQAWMFKRHPGFDFVMYDGRGGTSYIPHNLAKTPEMIWVKRRNATENWLVYHKGFNGGTNPENYWMMLNTTTANTYGFVWGQTAPTSTVFTVSDGAWVNGSGSRYIAMLFASVEGISKCGYYTGNGSSITITTGFQPRFLLVKNASGTQDWYVLDTTRGWGAGDDKHLSLNTTAAQGTWEFGAPTSTGFSFPSGNGGFNGNNEKYIYYAHA